MHTFEISLPSDLNIIAITGCHKDKNTCVIINKALAQINEIRMNTKFRLNTTLETIMRLVPEKHLLPKSKSKRSLFGIIGQVSRGFFGTATLDDINMLANHINALKRNTKKIMSSIEQHEEHLASYIKLQTNA